MKQKILDALKTKYSNKGFSKEALNGVASYLEKTVTDESQIDNVVDGVEPLLSVFQSDADKLRNENTTLKAERDELKRKAGASPANGGEQGKNNATDNTEQEPAWFTAYKQEQEERFNSLKQESDTLKAEKAKTERAALISETAKKYRIPEKFVKRFSPSEDEDLDEFFKGVKQDFIDEGFEFSEPPVQGSGVSSNGNDVAALIERDTKQIVEHQKTK